MILNATLIYYFTVLIYSLNFSLVAHYWGGACTLYRLTFHLKYEMRLQDISKGLHSTCTDNAVEAFNQNFNSLLSCHHPSIRALIKSLMREEALMDNTYAHINRGDMNLNQPSAKEAIRNARITNIVQSYISSDPDKILRGIAVNYM